MREDLLTRIKQEFRENKHLTDTQAIKTAIKEAQRYSAQLNSLLDKNHESELNSNIDQYRVGTGWPWDRKEG